MPPKMTRNFKRAYIQAVRRRQIALVEASEAIAVNYGQIVQALEKEYGQIVSVVRALDEISAFSKEIQGGHEALAGHAQEGAHLASDAAHEAAHVATLSINMPEVLAVLDTPGQYALPANYTEEMLRKVMQNIETDLRQAAGTTGGVSVGLLVKRREE